MLLGTFCVVSNKYVKEKNTKKSTSTYLNIYEYKNLKKRTEEGNDWTPAIKRALKDLKEKNGGTLYFPFGIYYISNIIVPSNVTLLFDSPGVQYDYKLSSPSCFKVIEGTKGYSIIFKSYSKAQGVVLEGNNNGRGIKTESHVTVADVSVFRTNGNGIEIGLGNTVRNIHSAYNKKNGIVFLKSDSMLTQFYSYGNHQNGLYIGQGVANVSIAEGKLEWNNSNNLSLYNANNIYFSNINIDRAAYYGVRISGSVKAFFTNVRLWRNYRYEIIPKEGRAQIYMDGRKHRIYLTNVSMEHGKNDNGRGTDTPEYGVTGWNLDGRIYISNIDIENGYTNSFFAPYSRSSIQLIESSNIFVK